MKIDRVKLLKLYMKEVNEICEVCDWKTDFGPPEIVGIISSLLEKHNNLINSREYYYEIDGKRIPDEESMAAYLIDEDVLFLGNGKSTEDKNTTALYVNVNDWFGPGSDAEGVTCNELPKLYDLFMEKKYIGVTDFVANKRGIENKHWRTK